VVTFHEASMDDAARLYQWRVDSDTADSSIAPPPASFDEHCEWLATVLRDPLVALYVGYDGSRGVPVGTVRLDRRGGGEAEISITVAPDERGRGYSHDLIAYGIEAAGNVRVVARVKASNARSLRAFRALGFSAQTDGELLRLVREPAPARRGADA
jgi:RimJ/RimL family protein N-acetyltransferase